VNRSRAIPRRHLVASALGADPRPPSAARRDRLMFGRLPGWSIVLA